MGPDGVTLQRLGDKPAPQPADAPPASPSSGSDDDAAEVAAQESPVVESPVAALSAPASSPQWSDLCFADLRPSEYARRFERTPLLLDRRPELSGALGQPHRWTQPPQGSTKKRRDDDD